MLTGWRGKASTSRMKAGLSLQVLTCSALWLLTAVFLRSVLICLPPTSPASSRLDFQQSTLIRVGLSAFPTTRLWKLISAMSPSFLHLCVSPHVVAEFFLPFERAYCKCGFLKGTDLCFFHINQQELSFGLYVSLGLGVG